MSKQYVYIRNLSNIKKTKVGKLVAYGLIRKYCCIKSENPA